MAIEQRKLFKAILSVSALTLLSRVLGLYRDRMIISSFDNVTKDAFAIAFKIPNLFRKLSADGAFTAAFVPVLNDYIEAKDRGKLDAFVTATYWVMSLLLLVFSLLGILFAAGIIAVYVPGFAEHPEKRDLTVSLTQWMFFYIYFASIGSFFSGVLNSVKKFAVPSLSPLVFNIVWIAGTWILEHFVSPAIYATAISVLIGGFCQVVMQIPTYYKMGFNLRPNFNLRHEGIWRMLRLIAPTLFGVAVYQLNLMVTDFIASFYEQVQVNWLYFANRVFQLPMGLFAVAISTVILPELSKYASRNDMVHLKETLSFGLRISFLLIIPATLALLVLAFPIVSLLFYSGTMDMRDCQGISDALIGYSVGLLAVTTTAILSRAFYSLKDTKTPVWASFYTMLANAVLSVVLVHALGALGLALAVSLSSYGNSLYLAIVLRKRLGGLHTKALVLPTIKISLAALAMIVIVASMNYWLAPYWLEVGVTLPKLLGMILLVGTGIALFFAGVKIMRLEELNALMRRGKRT